MDDKDFKRFNLYSLAYLVLHPDSYSYYCFFPGIVDIKFFRKIIPAVFLVCQKYLGQFYIVWNGVLSTNREAGKNNKGEKLYAYCQSHMYDRHYADAENF